MDDGRRGSKGSWFMIRKQNGNRKRYKNMAKKKIDYLSKSDQRELSDEKKAFVPIRLAQIGNDVIVPIELTQIPNVLFATGWTNHQIIMNRCKTDSESLFYMHHNTLMYG
jgi:hypothetical protein